jgi:ribose/xylose/arabinose/galactoside ABC-type transport system permease subunit
MKLTGGRVAVPGLVFAVLVVFLFWGGTQAGKVTGQWQTVITLQEYIRLSRDTTVHH